MKTKIQVYLEQDQDKLLEHVAQDRQVSKSQLIRESLERYLEELVPPEADPALGIVNLAGRVGRRDLSERHDAHLARLTAQGRSD